MIKLFVRFKGFNSSTIYDTGELQAIVTFAQLSDVGIKAIIKELERQGFLLPGRPNKYVHFYDIKTL